MTKIPDTPAQALANYAQLLAKVDAKFSEIRGRHEDSFQCAKGCHSCCKPGLTVNALEAHAIRNWIGQRPDIRQKIKDLQEQNPHQGQRCSLLAADGACAVYEVRPIVCRSHGAPLKFKDKGIDRRDVCPLNFSGDISTLSGENLVNLDLLNTLLSLITQQFGASEERIPLSDL